jgi:hypothetical protein
MMGHICEFCATPMRQFLARLHPRNPPTRPLHHLREQYIRVVACVDFRGRAITVAGHEN